MIELKYCRNLLPINTYWYGHYPHSLCRRSSAWNKFFNSKNSYPVNDHGPKVGNSEVEIQSYLELVEAQNAGTKMGLYIATWHHTRPFDWRSFILRFTDKLVQCIMRSDDSNVLHTEFLYNSILYASWSICPGNGIYLFSWGRGWRM